jgi:hypothetical protein
MSPYTRRPAVLTLVPARGPSNSAVVAVRVGGEQALDALLAQQVREPLAGGPALTLLVGEVLLQGAVG